AQTHTQYGAIQQQLEQMGVTQATPHDVSKAVMAIRRSKLPDPKITGNAGSFFKNPTIAIKEYEALLHSNKDMPSYAVNEIVVKIPAGWLIEQCGWKGYREGDA